MREVRYEEAKRYADENGFLFKETSAVSSYNVSEIFLEILESKFRIKILEIHAHKTSYIIENKEEPNIVLESKENKTYTYKCCK